ncbi:MAG TPA: MDR family MFS transporter [Pseudolabrys sp.]|nr:MDR family MFS transporter [Pseudolabrys sp.]
MTDSKSDGIAPVSAHDRVVSRQSSRTLILIASIAVIVIAAVEGTIVSTSMPTIVGALGGFESLTWVFSAYFLTQALTIPIYGGLADLYGRKRVLLFGIGLFLVGSVLCGMARRMDALIAFRVIQGVGAGALVTLAQTIIGDHYEPVERARLQGYISGAWAIGAILGPLFGSVIVTHFNWAWVFWVNVPVGCIAAGMIMAALHEQIKPHQRRIDYVGAPLMAAGTGLLMFVLVQASALGTFAILAMTATSLALLGCFAVHEARTPDPILPIGLMTNRIIVGGIVVGLAVGSVLMGSTAFLSFYIQGVMGLSAMIAGLAVGAPSVSWPLGSFVGGRLLGRVSYRATSLIGMPPLAIGVLLLIALTPTRGAVWTAVAPALIGIGMGFIVPTFLVAVQASVGWEKRGIATSTTVFSRIVGQAIGTAVFGGILNAAVSRHAIENGDNIQRIMNPTLRASMPASELNFLIERMSAGLHNIYLIIGLLVLVILLAILALPARLRV